MHASSPHPRISARDFLSIAMQRNLLDMALRFGSIL